MLYEINNKVSIESGLHYSDKGYQYDMSGLTFGDMIDPRYGFVYQTQTAESDGLTWYYHFTYLDVPFKMVYSFPGKKIQFVTEGGFVANIFLSAYEKIGSEKVERNDDFNNLGLSAMIGLGARYKFNERFSLSMIPDFQYSLTNVKSSTINEHLWSAGINVGGYFRF